MPDQSIAPMPFTSTPTGRAVKTLGAGLLGYILANFAPVLVTLPHQEMLIPIYATVMSWIGRYFKNKGIDLKVV